MFFKCCFRLIHRVSKNLHKLFKHKSTKFVNNASRRFKTWQHWNPFIDPGVKVNGA